MRTPLRMWNVCVCVWPPQSTLMHTHNTHKIRMLGLSSMCIISSASIIHTYAYTPCVVHATERFILYMLGRHILQKIFLVLKFIFFFFLMEFSIFFFPNRFSKTKGGIYRVYCINMNVSYYFRMDRSAFFGDLGATVRSHGSF